MHDNEEIRFTAKELLVEVRNDIRTLVAGMGLKADRDRVHILATELTKSNLSRAETERTLEHVKAAVDDHGHRLDIVERIWDRVAGGLKVAAASFGIFSALLVALFIHLLSSTPK